MTVDDQAINSWAGTARARGSRRGPLHESLAKVVASWFGDRDVVIEPWTAATEETVAGSRGLAGFSGAPLARVQCDAGTFMLKAFAAATPLERAAWVHTLVGLLVAARIREVPPLRRTPCGDTLVADPAGRLWEMTRFVPGAATAVPSQEQAAAVLGAVARLHRAATMLPGSPRAAAVPAAVIQRQQRARMLLAHPWTARRAAVEARADDESLLIRWDRAIAMFAAAAAARSLAAVATFPSERLPVQPVIRDLWSAHVLFAPGERRDAAPIVGIVDFHAAGIDTPATDCARLLGSWWPDADATTRAALVEAGLEAYDRERRLSPVERGLVPFLAATGVVFGLDNWFRWTLEERRPFPSRRAVEDRIDTLLAALPGALESLASGAPFSRTRQSGSDWAV